MKSSKPKRPRQRIANDGHPAANSPTASNPRSETGRTVSANAANVAKATARTKGLRKLRLMVSSTVYGHENLLDSIHGLLTSFGYEVWMSVAGTLKVNPRISAMTNCIEAVEQCDLFLGLILPRYGSGKEEPEAQSITHRELLRAIERDIPRWFLVHEHVVVARQLYEPFRDHAKKPGFQFKKGIVFTKTAMLDDLRVLEMYETAMRHDIANVAARTGNWVQPFGSRKEALLFASAQFRRYQEVLDDLTKNLSNEPGIRARVKGERK